MIEMLVQRWMIVLLLHETTTFVMIVWRFNMRMIDNEAICSLNEYW